MFVSVFRIFIKHGPFFIMSIHFSLRYTMDVIVLLTIYVFQKKHSEYSIGGFRVYIWASIPRHPPPSPHPMVMGLYSSALVPPTPPVVWVVVGGSGGGRSCICMYMYVFVCICI